jgi:ABC-type glycerol-3-phosphate transport system substrate-binding protein
VATGFAPDVAVLRPEDFYKLMGFGMLQPLNRWIEGEFSLDDFYAGDAFMRNGALYAVPNVLTPASLIYVNRRIFEEAGVAVPTPDETWDWTWTEFAALLEKVAPHGGIFMEDALRILLESYLRTGLMDDRETPSRWQFDAPEAVAAAEMLQEMILSGGVSLLEERDMQTVWANQDVAMAYGPLMGDVRYENFERAFIYGPASEDVRGYAMYGSALTILPTTTEPDLAWEYVKFWLWPDFYESWPEMQGFHAYRPLVEVFKETVDDDHRALIEAFERTVPFAHWPARTPAWDKVLAESVPAAYARIESGEDVRVVMNDLQMAAQRAL